MHKSISLILLLLFMGLFWACGGKESSDGDHIDQFTGMDTTRPLLSDADLKEMDQIVLIPFRNGDLWGFADTSLSVAIPAQFQQVRPFSENLAVVMKDSLFGVIDKRGREIVPPQFPLITQSACGVFTIKTPAGFILVNNQGKRVTQKAYPGTFSYTCTEDRIPIMDSGKVAFFDTRGRPVTGFEYDAIYKFQHGRAPVRIGPKSTGKWGAIDRSGKVVVPIQYEMVFPFVSGLAVAIQRNAEGAARWGVLDSTGQVLIPFNFGRISGTFAGNYVVCVEEDPMRMYMEGREDDPNKWFIYNRQGNKTGETDFELIDDFSEGLVVMSQNEKYGFADHRGKAVIPARYDWACGFQKGMAWVGQAGRYGFIDKVGNIVIPLKYAPAADYVFMENDGVKVLDINTSEAFYLDRHGNEFRFRE